MKITTKGHYGLQVMVDLARYFGQGPIALSDISSRNKLSAGYLEQLMMVLRKKNLVKAKRGASGGYELSRPPAKISLGEVIETLEGPLAPVSCVSTKEKKKCPQANKCLSQNAWLKVRQSIERALNSVNLGEIVNV